MRLSDRKMMLALVALAVLIGAGAYWAVSSSPAQPRTPRSTVAAVKASAKAVGLDASSKPYPLDIPPAKRNTTEKVQARLDYVASTALLGRIPPLMPQLKGKVPTPSQVAEVRLASAVPTLDWTTTSSAAPLVVSVHSDSASLSRFELAMTDGKDTCWLLLFDRGAVRFGVAPDRRPDQCFATLAPAGGWKPGWPPGSSILTQRASS